MIKAILSLPESDAAATFLLMAVLIVVAIYIGSGWNK